MDLRQLRTFRAVARELSFTQAAARLNYAQSSVTAQIKALETDLGVPLFERLGRRVLLTDAGHGLLPYADELLRLHDEARCSVAELAGGAVGGTLRIGAPESLCAYRLPPVLHRFTSRFPGVRMTFRPRPRPQLLDDLGSGVLDVAFLVEQPLELPGLSLEPVIPEPYAVVVDPASPLARRDPVAPADLAGETLLLFEADCTPRAVFEAQLGAAGCVPSAVLEFTSIEAIKRCVAIGLGVAALPAAAIGAELDCGELVALRWDGPDFGLSVQIARHCRRRPTPAVAALTEIARELWGEEDCSAP